MKCNNNLNNENSGEAQNNNNSIIGNNITINDQKENDIKKGTNINDLFNKASNEYTLTFENYRVNPLLFKNKLKEKISSLNKWIKEGINFKNFEGLKEDIRQILIGLDEIKEIIMVKKYYFYKPGLLKDNNIKIDDIEDEKKEKEEKKLKIFGTIKNGIIKVGKKIQSKSKDKKEKSDKKNERIG